MRGRRTLRSPAMGAVLVALLGGSAAEAQLLPNLPIHKRERPDCSQEKPVYGLYRNKYYGYYPTCWRQFPPGWGCPSNEAPNWEADLARLPLDIPEEGGLGYDDFGAGGLGAEDEDPFRGNGRDDLLPELPPARSPFDLDRPDSGASPFEMPGRSRSPFEDPFEPRTPTVPDSEPGNRPAAPSPFDLPGASTSPGSVPPPSELPSVAPPVSEAGRGASSPRGASMPELAVLPDSRPRPISLPALPSPSATGPMAGTEVVYPASLPPSTTPGIPSGMVRGEAPIGARGIIVSEPDDPPYTVGDPVIMGGEYEPRPRRGFLSGLFGRRN
ncbi:hypothetical protein [Tautonia sociabilis]|uniref:Uncharacterized protein n=1 Tax=Tautonia sociabilis TaxID=2080755 RepID=A0A432MPZ9_9BACT|nr:hypothetical protein [Tautonia sociabilis]RUL89563.1 hypothetical protein TsocGM_01980 [Tautonia sociabilis]